MAEDDLRKGSNLLKFVKKLVTDYGIKKKEFTSVQDIFGESTEEGLLPSSRSSSLPDEEFKVGTLRDKETGISKGKTGTTYLGLSNTKKIAKDLVKKGEAYPGELITPENVTPDVEKEIQANRPRIEKDIKAGSVFPIPNQGETFEDYYKRVKLSYPTGGSMVALQAEAAKQYAMRFPQYKNMPKLLDLINQGVIPLDIESAEVAKGFKIPDPKNVGIKNVITELLEKNEGYVTVAKSIDPYIDDLVKSIPQKDFDRFAVDLMGEVDPDTEKPYTKAKIKTLVANRLKFAVAQYWNKGLTPDIVDEIMKSLQGSQSSVNVDKIATNAFQKIGVPKITAFTAALSSIIKSGNASALLKGGTGALLGPVTELAFPNKAEAAELFSEDEMSKMRIADVFGGEESYNEMQNKILKEKGIGGL